MNEPAPIASTADLANPCDVACDTSWLTATPSRALRTP
jgi:hypothetical protein